MQNKCVVVIGTGGTIAGLSNSTASGGGYTAAQLAIETLVEGLPGPVAGPLECEQVGQIDSKDMNHALWQRLARRVSHHLQRADVQAVVVTHGTDTLEETAFFLQRLLAPRKPVVIVGALRPADAPDADGPQNLLDALRLSREPGARGVLVVLGGQVHEALEVAKLHPDRLEAFGSSPTGPLGRLAGGRYLPHRDWPPLGQALGVDGVERDVGQWPRVELITSHAGADGRAVKALVDSGVQGLVVACTGLVTVHEALAQALRSAVSEQGVRVLRCARSGAVSATALGKAPPGEFEASALSPVKARVELLLRLLQEDVAVDRSTR